MSILLSAYQLSKSFASQNLFSNLTFAVESGDRIGLIGPNGMGKSTLLKILSGKTSADSGELSLCSGLKIGFLEQTPNLNENYTIFETLSEGIDLHDWEAQSKVHEAFSRFDLQKFGESCKIKELSGGWKKRVALAKELLFQPDLLLLDEPTNHLDLESIMWLEDFLSQAPFASLTVSHDRLFLQRVATQILELDRRHENGILKIKGDYSQYVEAREVLISGQEKRELALKNTLRRETEWLKQGAKARTTKQSARIHRAQDLKEEVENLSDRNQNKTASFQFHHTGRNPKKLIELENVSKSFDERVLFEKVNLKITPSTRLGLLGTNGAGKSTLLNILLGNQTPSSGSVSQADTLQVAYFDQTRDTLDPELSILETVCPKGSHVEFGGKLIHVNGYLERFLFDHKKSDIKIGKLSGGEQSRLLIALLMLKPANVLILDEPTNDLDLATLGVLEECLNEFPGAVIIVTHDRYFLNQVADQIIAFPLPHSSDKKLQVFSDFSQWEEWVKQNQAPAEKVEKKFEKEKSKQKRFGFNEKREFEGMEKNILNAESELERLTEETQKESILSDSKKLQEITEKMSKVQDEITRLYARWEELETLRNG